MVALIVQPNPHHGVLTSDAREFVVALERRFRTRRADLLLARAERHQRLLAGEQPRFLEHTAAVRDGGWEVAPPPPALTDRRVELSGGVDHRSVTAGLASGAQVYLADFEDSTAPSWPNILDGHDTVARALRRQLSLAPSPTATTLVVRPRGWHLDEANVEVDGHPVSASLFDVGLTLFHGAEAAIEAGSGPYFSLPKLDGHLEARLWNDVFCHAQDLLGMSQGSVKASVVIESVLAAVEMDEILYELREHSAGLTAGRWDYLASLVRALGHQPGFVLGDRADIGPDLGMVRSCTDLLIATCHRRGAHAIGPITRLVPTGDDWFGDLDRVARTKQREAHDGFDGTRVAHCDLVDVAADAFRGVLGDRPHQIQRQRTDVTVTVDDLLTLSDSPRPITDTGLRTEIGVLVRYLAGWLHGCGVLEHDGVADGAATAELSRTLVWHWVTNGCRTTDGAAIDADRVRHVVGTELERVAAERALSASDVDAIASVLDDVLFTSHPHAHLTPTAYSVLRRMAQRPPTRSPQPTQA